MMRIYCDSIDVDLAHGIDITDITTDLEASAKASGILRGVVTATVIGSTGSLTTIEYEPGVVEDLKEAIDRLGASWPRLRS
jgi:thiamine phosphate synthase YjbQ (UPF0047 family)